MNLDKIIQEAIGEIEEHMSHEISQETFQLKQKAVSGIDDAIIALRKIQDPRNMRDHFQKALSYLKAADLELSMKSGISYEEAYGEITEF